MGRQGFHHEFLEKVQIKLGEATVGRCAAVARILLLSYLLLSYLLLLLLLLLFQVLFGYSSSRSSRSRRRRVAVARFRVAASVHIILSSCHRCRRSCRL